jgi:hypothetical protein
MLRTILFLIIFGLSFLISGFVIDDANIDRAAGDLLEAVLGPLTDENDIAGFALIGLLAAWLAFGIVMAVPAWRRRMAISLTAWPLSGRPVASFFLRTFSFVVLGAALFLVVGGLDLVMIIPLGIVVFGYLGMLVNDFHGMLLRPEYLQPVDFRERNTSVPGWILPDSITADMLGTPELRYELAKDLRRRASQMRRFSFVALAGIAALLVVAVNVILFAGFIANLGVGVTGPERIQQMLNAEELALDRAQADLRALERRKSADEISFYRGLNRTRADIRDLDSEYITDEMRVRFALSEPYQVYLARKKSLERAVGAHLVSTDRILEERTNYLIKSIREDFGTAEQTNNLNLLIASGITRFGILFIMLFIVQILVNLYRYTMRMSAYYLSQADAMLLAEDGGDGLLKVVPVLSPQDVDFGKAPQTPVQNLEKMLELAAKLR